ncbi:phage portal protein [Psychromonas hadalis]|uniref:phage portal protein n=1 Tax=Psychromonas hadalis TaxID=211669 RepID=UPI0003B3AFC1|nr:phage portal protein [Psychromonas hadalis]
MMIEFGEPQSVLKSDIMDYVESALVDGYFEPPVSLEGLAKTLRANAMHSSAIYAKRNMVSATLELIKGKLSKRDCNRWLFDFGVFGNAYLLRVVNGLGDISFKHLPAMYMRRREKVDCYSYKTESQTIDYKEGQVFHLMEYDVTQEIYGIPQYFASLSSVWLNEDATLFRRKYYLNGAHSGFLLYMNNPNLTDDQEKEIIAKLNSAKGLGNFKNMFINGKGKDGEKPELIPVGQLDAKDEFSKMKNVTTGDILSAHRIPLDLMSIVREGFSPVGDLNKVDKMFYKNEIKPIGEILLELNDFAGFEVIKLKEYENLNVAEA